ncbi:MAG: S1 RNA-binding domain-containing protein [Candidatus Diapherotrites archaeon]|nr:S1 RNA-binding domain-containing protein [Candidatus Diapherotrites archaeon]
MDFPERDDFAVVKVIQILDYGVFVELLEYKNSRGFVHISNVSSSWVKNIRNFVKMNQVRVAKVLNVDILKKQIDLSFAGVNPMRERQVLNQYKQINREEKLIEILARETKKPFDEVWTAVAEPLTTEFGSLYEAFEKIALGAQVSSSLAKEWIAPVKDLVEKNVVVSKKEISGKLKLFSSKAGGLGALKDILSEAESVKGCLISYAGGGFFNVSCASLTFKEADKTLSLAITNAEKKAKKLGVEFEFKRDEKK